MRRAVLAAIPAVLIAGIVLLWTPDSIHRPPTFPDKCSSVSYDGKTEYFCLKYIPEFGRYEYPPFPVPADFAHVNPGGAPVDTRTYRYRSTLPSLLAFAIAFIGLWVVLTIAPRGRPGRRSAAV